LTCVNEHNLPNLILNPVANRIVGTGAGEEAWVMKISFPRTAPGFDSESFTLVFPAEVDSTRIECGITAEALEDHFGARSISEPDLVKAFRAHRGVIEEAAVVLIEAAHGAPVVLHSGVFRVYGR
jgi:hypothetical protein